jgi:hypothetical protein
MSLRLGLAFVLIAAPPLAFFVLMFGGDVVTGGCPVRPSVCPPNHVPSPIPLIGTRFGADTTFGVLAVAWFASVVGLAVLAWRSDRWAAARLAALIAGSTVLAAGLAFGAGYVALGRLRTAAEAGGWAALIVFLVALILGLARSARVDRRHVA